MKFSYNWLKEYVDLPKPKELVELLTMHAFEVEGVEKIKGDYVLDIDVLPNRGSDCFSCIGMAREISAITNKKLKLTNSKVKESSKSYAKDLVSVYVKEKNLCDRYSARVVLDVKVKESPKKIKDYLIACGLKPINNIVDLTNYVMLETGQPLHAFDLDKIEGERIFVRKANKKEKITSLDNKEYVLNEGILVIADNKEPLAIAGIKGGKKAEIDKNTKRIVVESANFKPSLIRQTSKEINLKTDASWRFEHKIDPDLTSIALDRFASLVDGEVSKGIVDIYNFKNKPRKIKLNMDYARDLLGLDINKKDVLDILKRLGFKYSNGFVTVPEFRLDINIEEDLIEEIGRLYGYEKIPSVFPIALLSPPERNPNIYWQNFIKNTLKELGFSEVYNYSFVREAKLFGGAIELENPISSEQKYLRPSLISNLLKNVETNFKYFDQFKIFELGKIFTNKGEKNMLSGLVAKKNPSKQDFYYLKGVIDSLLNKIGITDIYYDDYKPTPEDSSLSIWNQKEIAEIQANGKEIGFIGRIGKAVLFDIDFDLLQKLSSEENIYQPISQYPSAVRDIAVLVPLEIKVVEVMNLINSVEPKLIKDIDLFDIYEGEGIPGGMKNLAFHIIYQAEDRTLSSSEVNKLQDKIIKALEQKSQWQVRK